MPTRVVITGEGSSGMSSRFFLDTDVIVYSFDASIPFKQKKAQELIAEALSAGTGVVSSQVVQEFLHIALKKFKVPLALSDAREYCEKVLFPLCEVFPGYDFFLGALDVKERSGVSIDDALIIQAALTADCPTLYSEEIKEGLKLFNMTVKNPFR